MSSDRNNPDPTPDREPTAGNAEAPVWLVVLIAVLILWGMIFLDARGGGFNARVYEPYASFKQVDDLQPRSAEAEIARNGRKIYDTYCSVCHQPTGQGLAGQFPPLTESEWVTTPGADRLIRLVLDGIQGPITVKGQAYNNAMPPWKELLKDEEIAAVLSYIRSHKGWGNNASGVTSDQVKAVRAKSADRSTPWSPEELLALPDKE